MIWALSLLATVSMLLLFELANPRVVVMSWVFIHWRALIIIVVAMFFLLSSGSTPTISMVASLTLCFLLYVGSMKQLSTPMIVLSFSLIATK